MYNEKIYLDWIEERHSVWEYIVFYYKMNLKRSFVFFTEDKKKQNEYLEYSKKYFQKEKK